jgi:competence protein ComGC
MRRRSSGEVINATLMEVFLFLSFLVLILLHSAVTAKEEAEKKSAEAEETATQLRHDVVSLDHKRRQAEQERDVYKEKYISNHPPDCRLEGVASTVVEVCIASANRLHVEMLATVGSHKLGEKALFTPDAFRRSFADVWELSQRHECRFHALVRRELGVQTGDYIDANRPVAQLFYSDWSSKPCELTQID